jgi:hypothetical protein
MPIFLDDYLLTNITVGNPQQGPFQVMFSSGETRLWILGTTMPHLKNQSRQYYVPGFVTVFIVEYLDSE